MKTLSKPATLTFQKILQEMNGKEYLKLNRAPDAFMPLTIERLTDISDFPAGPVVIYSLAHYYKQNGDLVPDPDVTFAVAKARPDFVVPMTFQNAIYYSEAIVQENNRWMISTKVQHDLVDFANNWMKNLKWQQNLK